MLAAADVAGALIGLAALVLSLAALTWTIVSSRRSTTNLETQALKRDIDVLKAGAIQTGRELDECKEGKAELMKQNFDLMLEVHSLSKQGGI